MVSASALCSALAITTVLFIVRISLKKVQLGASHRLPPGPKGYPLIGNLYDIPKNFPWKTYVEWKQQYGDVVSFTVLGKTTIVLNSLKAALELLDKRSSNFSGRPRLITADELLGWEWDFAHMSYTDRWRQHRRVFHQYFQPRNLTKFYPAQRKFAVNLISQLGETPSDFIPHIQQYVASIVLRAAYGYEIKKESDGYIEMVHAALEPLHPVIHATSSSLVEFLPALKGIPAWMPGAGFKRQALADAPKSQALRDKPFESVKASIAAGIAQPSFVLDNLEKIRSEHPSGSAAEEEVVKNCAGIVFLAGSDTTVSLLTAWVLAMGLYPEIQKRAQNEIEKVVGKDRLPEFTDVDSLPYIEAVLLETMRWHTVTPLALPHIALNDDVYDGYYIPAGTTVTVNTSAILHDEDLYPNPLTFNPERFLKDGKLNFDHQPDPVIAGGFGFGRRVCPGRFLAMNSARIAILFMLITYDIREPTDTEGVAVDPCKINVLDGVVSHPEAFKVHITPRSRNSIQLVETAKMEASF